MKKSEIDREVAFRVMGLNQLTRKVPKYSKDIGEAMKVLDAMRQKDHRWLLVSSADGFFLRHLGAVSKDLDRDEKNYRADRPIGTVATTLSELAKMICEAALEESVK